MIKQTEVWFLVKGSFSYCILISGGWSAFKLFFLIIGGYYDASLNRLKTHPKLKALMVY